MMINLTVTVLHLLEKERIVAVRAQIMKRIINQQKKRDKEQFYLKMKNIIIR